MTLETYTLTFHIKDHRGAPLAVSGVIGCFDTQSDQIFQTNLGAGALQGDSVGRIRNVPELIQQTRFELWLTDIFLNVVSSSDPDNLDRLLVDDIQLLTGTHRISVAEDMIDLSGDTVRAGRLLRQDGDFILDGSNLASYSFHVRLTSETRSIIGRLHIKPLWT